MWKSATTFLSVAALAIGGVNPVVAATATGTMAVTLTVLSACTVTPTPLAFGSISGLMGSAANATASVVVACTPGTAFSVTMDNGLNASSGQRRVKGVTPTNFVNYNLYTDAARTNSWSGATSVNGTGSATLTVYGQVPVQAGIAIDVYTDTVTVTATY